MQDSYFKKCTGSDTYISSCISNTESTNPEKVRLALDMVKGTPLADIISGLAYKCSELDNLISTHKKIESELQTELNYVLADWNSLVSASGSRTNGGAVGYVAQMRIDLVNLKKENDALRRQLFVNMGVYTE